MTMPKLMLDYVYERETSRADEIYLTQPQKGGQVIDYTWRQVMDQARRMATHLQSHGFEPGARIAILSKNCAHFFMSELAIWMAGFTTVAIFPTETASTVRYVLEHSEASLLFVGKLDTWPQQVNGVPTDLPCIAFPLAPYTTFETWDSVIDRNEPMKGKPARRADDIALLIYTSGSTGEPKGVMQSFNAITHTTVCINQYRETLFENDIELRMISYLPLAHVFERLLVEFNSIVSPNTHVFFAESMDTFIQDIRRARPTFFLSVPRLWLKFQQGVFAKMPQKKLERLLRIPILGRIVGRKVLKGLGLDQVILACSSSAPIPAEILSWYRSLGLQLYEAYGMTENMALSHNSTPEFNAPGYVGVPWKGVQVRISEEGEVQVKSPGQMVGYYKRPELNADIFTEDGFLRTGDRGEMRPDGLLKITGRTKELFKTAKGKYVAPAPIENQLNANPLIEMTLVSGVGQPSAYAIVVLAEEIRPKLGDPQVRAQVEVELKQLLDTVNNSLVDYEKIRMLVVASEPWTIENGFLTPTMKLKRSRIEAAVEGSVEAWYAAKGTVQWA